MARLVQGKIDAAQEIGRLEKKVVLANTNADKIKKLQGQDNYETALPENVRQKNADQVSPRTKTGPQMDPRLI